MANNHQQLATVLSDVMEQAEFDFSRTFLTKGNITGYSCEDDEKKIDGTE